MKAYRRKDGTVTMFRPDMNMKRMNSSARRLALPVSRFPDSHPLVDEIPSRLSMAIPSLNALGNSFH